LFHPLVARLGYSLKPVAVSIRKIEREVVMHVHLRSYWALVLFVAISIGRSYAVPSFARQTGLSCNTCHRNPPELTQYGRLFKLRGFVITNAQSNERVGESSDLHITKYMPISAMVLVSNTAFQSTQPDTQNSSAGFPQQASIFLAGAYGSHFGGFAQVTYTHADDKISMDNTDLRYANHRKLGGHNFDYGFTLNNNPTVEDLWNSTPAWGFPWISSAAAISPIASPVINGGLAQDVAGVGGYSMFNNHLYTNVTAYRSEHAGSSTPNTGTGQAINITGVAPYWRAAWQQSFDHSYLEVGTYGIEMRSVPNGVSGTKDSYLDAGVDAQYDIPLGANQLDFHTSYVHEHTDLKATFAAEGADFADHSLNTAKFDTVFHLNTKYSATAALFSTFGKADPTLYASAPLSGSANGSPNTNGYIAQLAYWPVQNVGLHVNYTGYWKFNGARLDYDGTNRNATDNGSIYMAAWFIF
jgi:hypothetical protein